MDHEQPSQLEVGVGLGLMWWGSNWSGVRMKKRQVRAGQGICLITVFLVFWDPRCWTKTRGRSLWMAPQSTLCYRLYLLGAPIFVVESDNIVTMSPDTSIHVTISTFISIEITISIHKHRRIHKYTHSHTHKHKYKYKHRRKYGH